MKDDDIGMNEDARQAFYREFHEIEILAEYPPFRSSWDYEDDSDDWRQSDQPKLFSDLRDAATEARQSGDYESPLRLLREKWSEQLTIATQMKHRYQSPEVAWQYWPEEVQNELPPKDVEEDGAEEEAEEEAQYSLRARARGVRSMGLTYRLFHSYRQQFNYRWRSGIHPAERHRDVIREIIAWFRNRLPGSRP